MQIAIMPVDTESRRGPAPAAVCIPEVRRRFPARTAKICSGLLAVVLLTGACPHPASADEPSRAVPDAEFPPLRNLRSHCPFSPPAARAAWDRRAAELRDQLRVSLGLWPMPMLDPVKPRITGRISLEGYTVEKVVFESLPGLFVTGNLYRPSPPPAGRRVPAVLCPHGHWENARFQDVTAEHVAREMRTGAERFANAARNPVQAGCVQLARMGCVVFQWDMLGYCDSTQISYARAHRFTAQEHGTEVTDDGWLLYSPLAEAHAQSVMGLQTLAALRSIDFVAGLPEVDPARIGITGASGGGTQSFIAAALDQRIGVAFPAVMVSTGMQGGCTCENACGLRVGTGNVEIACLIAPRPLGLTAADDWTKTMPEDGFPQMRELYGLFAARERVALFPALQFGHQFNHGSRGAMYSWMNRHLQLRLEEPIEERDFTWLGRDALTVWEVDGERPEQGEDFERRLLRSWCTAVDAGWDALGKPGREAEYRTCLQTGWNVVLGLTNGTIGPAVAAAAGDRRWRLESPSDGHWSVKQLADDAAGEAIGGSVSISVTARPEARSQSYGVALCGEAWDESGGVASVTEQPLVDTPRQAAAYTYGYNPPLLVRRARQLAATLSWLHHRDRDAILTVEGTGPGAGLAAAGVYCLAKTVPDCRESIRLRLRPDGFRFANAASIRSSEFLPGSARFLDLPGLVVASPVRAELIGADAEAFSSSRDARPSHSSR
ncbi:MAG: acetylxylan esterase [Planctomycetia bacterium]|nr:acetylxylan esterase [Planctomycetia bacterium]